MYVTLVDAEGNELPTKHDILVAPEGGLQLKLDSNLTAQFSLKVSELLFSWDIHSLEDSGYL